MVSAYPTYTVIYTDRSLLNESMDYASVYKNHVSKFQLNNHSKTVCNILSTSLHVNKAGDT